MTTANIGLAPRSKGYRARRREEILEQAALIANASGMDGLAMEHIAQRFDMQYTALYHYFRSKQALAAALYVRTLTLRTASLDAAFLSGRSGWEVVAAYIRAQLELGPRSRLRLGQLGSLGDEERAQVHQQADQHFARLMALIERGVSDGSLSPCHVCTTAHFVEAVIDRFNTLALPVREAGESHRALLDGMFDVLERGLLVRRDDWQPDAADPRDVLDILNFRIDDGNNEALRVEQILHAAMTAFNDQGAEAMSIPSLAAALGMSKTVVYRYVVDKEDLLFQCYQRGAFMLDIAQRIADVQARDPLHSVTSRYRLLYRAHGSLAGPLPVFSSWNFLKPPRRRSLQLRYINLGYSGRRPLQRGIAGGLFRANSSRLLPAHPMMSGPMRALPDWYLPDYPLSLDDIALQNVRIVMQGLRGAK